MSKVVVAMSGGVDSSVAAALLKQQGHEVIGIMLRLWSEPGKEASNRCCTPDSMALARRVATRLDIPFYVVDAKGIFRKRVVESFLSGYRSGITPNPCLICNRHIRWGFLLEHALAMGADFMATGHYARVKPEGKSTMLYRAVDTNKDQSYVLHVLTQEKLQRAIFPVGEFQKSEVRHLAERFDLPVAKRPDSQDLCFLAGEDYRSFILRNAPEILKPGKIITKDEQFLGWHTGLVNYTIGQRKGLGISSLVPLYVLGKDVDTNTLVVGVVDDLECRDLLVKEINWIYSDIPARSFRAEVKVRYTSQAVGGEVMVLDNQISARVHLDNPQRGITPGQAAVFYDGDLVLGGGIIT